MKLHLRFVAWLLVTPVVVGLSAPAWAQWQWTDASGRKVFSDTAPPSDIPDKNILRRPGERPAPPPSKPVADAAQGNTEADPAAKAALDKKAAALEAQKKQAEEAEKAKEKAQALKAAAAKADNCQRAQRNLASLGTGRMLSTVNDKGERVIMNEDTRNAEKARLQQIVQQSCTP